MERRSFLAGLAAVATLPIAGLLPQDVREFLAARECLARNGERGEAWDLHEALGRPKIYEGQHTHWYESIYFPGGRGADVARRECIKALVDEARYRKIREFTGLGAYVRGPHTHVWWKGR